MSGGGPQHEVGAYQGATRAPGGGGTTMQDDYSFGREYRARATELQDIAAMDRLAAQAAPASALRRYAASRRNRRAERRSGGSWQRLAGSGPRAAARS